MCRFSLRDLVGVLDACPATHSTSTSQTAQSHPCTDQWDFNRSDCFDMFTFRIVVASRCDYKLQFFKLILFFSVPIEVRKISRRTILNLRFDWGSINIRIHRKSIITWCVWGGGHAFVISQCEVYWPSMRKEPKLFLFSIVNFHSHMCVQARCKPKFSSLTYNHSHSIHKHQTRFSALTVLLFTWQRRVTRKPASRCVCEASNPTTHIFLCTLCLITNSDRSYNQNYRIDLSTVVETQNWISRFWPEEHPHKWRRNMFIFTTRNESAFIKMYTRLWVINKK